MKKIIVEHLQNGMDRYIFNMTTNPFTMHIVPHIHRAKRYDSKTATDFCKFLNRRFQGRKFEVIEVEE